MPAFKRHRRESQISALTDLFAQQSIYFMVINPADIIIQVPETLDAVSNWYAASPPGHPIEGGAGGAVSHEEFAKVRRDAPASPRRSVAGRVYPVTHYDKIARVPAGVPSIFGF